MKLMVKCDVCNMPAFNWDVINGVCNGCRD